MSTVKFISMEMGNDYSVSTVTMSNGETCKVIAVMDEDNHVTYVSESESGEALEDFALEIVKACQQGMINVITGD